MPLQRNIGAYYDCFDYFERAQASSRGVRLQFERYGDAHYFVLRMNQARVLQREESRRLYPIEDPRWGRSDYDTLQVRSPLQDTDGLWWIYIERHNNRVLVVEDLADVDPTIATALPAPPATLPLLIESTAEPTAEPSAILLLSDAADADQA